MNFNLANVVMFGIGAVLVYSAVKNVNPKDVVSNALGGKPQPKAQPQSQTKPADPSPEPMTVPTVFPSV